MGPDAMILVFWMLSFKLDFFFLFHIHQEVFPFFLSSMKSKDGLGIVLSSNLRIKW